MTLTPQERSVFGDLIWAAGEKLGFAGPANTRLDFLLSLFKASRELEWRDENRSYILGLIADTPHGQWWENRPVIEKYAKLIGTGIHPSPTWPTTPTPTPVPQPEPSPSPTPLPDPTDPAPAPTPTPPPISDAEFKEKVKAALASMDIHVDDGAWFSMGWPIDYENQAHLQLGGRIPAELWGHSNPFRTDGQNPDEWHGNSVVICDNDGGWRVRQYIKWFKGMVRNTLSRPGTMLAIDSWGDVCISDDREHGQAFYLVKRIGQGVIDLCTYITRFRVRILRSQATYGATDVDVIEETIRRILAEKGIH